MTNPARLPYLLGRITRTAAKLAEALPHEYEEVTREAVHGILLWCREAREHGATTEQLAYAVNSGMAQEIRSDRDLIPGLSPSDCFTGVLDIAADHLVLGLTIGHRTYRVRAHEHTPYVFTHSREYVLRRASQGPLPTADVTFTIDSDTHPVTAAAHANVGPELVPALRALS
ncbi:hypothetical protein [Nocardia nova]|uniref:hypothetical protein n=1 Tax=Nocardia nova TaxID=37330 RepID=UPI00340A9D37